MLNFIKGLPWWVWVGLIIAGIFIWQAATGAALTNKMWHMVKDQIVTDQTKVVQNLESNMKMYETEIAKLQDQIAQVQKDKAALAQQQQASQAEIARLKGRINDLQTKLANIVVPNDPSAVIGELKKRFPTIRLYTKP